MHEGLKGKGAVGVAISYFALRGMVCIPLEPCDYNLIFDDGKYLYRVKVISCSYKTKYGIFCASIRAMGNSAGKQYLKKFDSTLCDIVFIVTSEMDLYRIPSELVKATRQISLSVYGEFKTNLIPS